MKVSELVEQLQKVDQNKEVRLAVGWAKDTALSDVDDDVQIRPLGDRILLEGWLSNCGTELIISEEEDEEEEDYEDGD